MNTKLTIVTGEEISSIVQEGDEETPRVKYRTWHETPITPTILFRAKDPSGRSGWFLRLTVSGLYPRRVGPYPTKTSALEALEQFLSEVMVEPLCDIENSMKKDQAYVIEGVPTLKAWNPTMRLTGKRPGKGRRG